MDLTATVNFRAIMPEIILAVTGLVALMVDVFIPSKRGEVAAGISLVGLLGAIVACFPMDRTITVFSGSYIIDPYSFYFKIVLFIIVSLTILMSIKYLKTINVDQGEFYVQLIFSILGLAIMVSGLDLIVIYLGLEMTAISSCTLVGFLVKDKRSNEAALKYFMLSVFSSGILLYGISWLYGITGTVHLYEIAEYLKNYAHLTNPGLQLSLLLLIVGFGFKIGYVPFHMWVPDVYEGAPTSIAGFLSLGPKAAGFAVLLRFFMRALQPLIPVWTGILWILAVITMVTGNIMALRQENLKRMLAYSGIAHVGYMLIAASALGKSPELGSTAILMYFMIYIFMNLGPFGIIILLCREKRMGDQIADFNGLNKHNSLAAVTMTIFMLSLAGIPPTGGFIAKFLVFATAIKSNYIWLAVIGVLNSTVAVFYYLRVVVAMFMEEPADDMELVLSPSLIVALTMMACLAMVVGIFPSRFIEFANHSVGALF